MTMKKLLVVLLSILATAPTFATTRTSDGSQTNTNTLLAASAFGDTVDVPAGSYTWGTSGLTTSIPAGVSLIFNGGLNNTPNSPGVSGTLTTITISTDFVFNYGSVLIGLSNNSVVAGVKFVDAGTASGTALGAFSCDGWRISNVDWDASAAASSGNSPYFVDAEQAYGCIDHLQYDGTNGYPTELLYGRGHTNAWQIPLYPGAAAGDFIIVNSLTIPQQVVIEDCLFNEYTACAVEFDSNARITVRDCKFTNQAQKIDLHGFATNGAPARGGRLIEAYNNNWSETSTDYNEKAEFRGGTMYFFNNTCAATGGGWWSAEDYTYQDYPLPNLEIPISGITAGGTSTVTTTVANGLGYPDSSPITTACGLLVECSNSTPTLAGTTAIAATVTSANTLTISASVTGAGTTGWIDAPTTPLNYPIQDQVARGEDVSTPFTGPSGTSGNPGYVWNNTLNGSPWTRTIKSTSTQICSQSQALYQAETGITSFTDNDIVKEGRDMFSDTVGSDVQSGTYAAMLASSGASVGYGWWATDKNELFTWNGSSWTAGPNSYGSNYAPLLYPYYTHYGTIVGGGSSNPGWNAAKIAAHAFGAFGF
jgi:hypothetical protein